MDAFQQQYGPWAIVTGASSGIGEAFAHALAARGLNLILIARRIDRLQALSAQLAQQHSVQVLALQTDLSDPTAWEGLVKDLEGYEVGLLVNNAGMSTNGPVHKVPMEKQLQLVNLNVTAPLVLSHRFGSKMLERKRGGVIHVGSQSSFFAVPYLTTYSASKAWLLHLGLGMAFEWRRQNVHVQTLCPGYTDTEMTAKIKGKVPMVSPEFVVEKSLKNLGKKEVVSPNPSDWIRMVFMNRFLSRERAANFVGMGLEKS